MARVESFTYGSGGSAYTVGGAAPTATTQIMGRFGWDFDAEEEDESAQFVAEFFLIGTSLADLNTKTTAMLTALRAKYGKLTVDWGASNVATYDPLVANATGFEAKPKISKSRSLTSTGFMRGFEFRVRVQLPSNYADANLPGTPAAGGRRTSSVNLHWDGTNRRRATVTGVFHEIAGKLPRALTTTAQTNAPDTTKAIDTYCLARLTVLDASTQWTLTSRDETDNNSQAILSFRREYSETIDGRLGSKLRIAFAPSLLRTITVTGSYARTYTTGTTTIGAKANYEDGAKGAKAFAVTQLAALTTDEGGALVPGQTCELIFESYPPNEQDDLVEYTLVYRELQWKQSSSSSGLDDADVVVDAVSFTLDYVPLEDSSAPTGGGDGAVPNPFQSVPGGASKPANTGGSTLDKSVVPADSGTDPGTVSGLLPTKPVDIFISYRATLKKSVTDLRSKWTLDIRPYLIGKWSQTLGFGPTYLVNDKFIPTVTDNTIAGEIHARALPGDLLEYVLEENVADDIGIAADPALTGTPYEYLLQQVFPERRKLRTHKAVFKAGGSFNPSSLGTVSSVPGYVVLRRSAPVILTKTFGIPSLGVNTQPLTYIRFTEELLYVSRAVPGSSALNNTTTPNGSPLNSSSSVVKPENPGGV